ncbi:MAG: hypothetical protein ABIQ77_00675 [Anaerolineales bacterium]
MNIHFQQVEKKSQVFSYMLAGLAVFTVLMLILGFSRHIELQLSIPSVSMQAVHSENTNMPVAIPAPLPPAEQAQTIVTPEPFGNSQAVLVPQAIAAPMPSVPL